MKPYRFKILIPLGVIIFLLLSFSAAGAQDWQRPGAFYVAPSWGGYMFDVQNDEYDNITAGLALGYNMNRNVSVEGGFNYIYGTSSEWNEDVDGYLLQVSGLYHFWPENRIVPFVAVGLGDLLLHHDGGGTIGDFCADYGVGLQCFVTDDLALRGEVRHVLTFPRQDLLYTIGISYAFGGKAEQPMEKAPETMAAPPMTETAPPPPEAVEKPAPPTISEVIYFDFDKTIIKPQYDKTLDDVSDVLKQDPEMKVKLEGNTDNRGSEKYNQNLSEKRADKVKKALEKRGVAEDRMETIGNGFSQPAASNKTKEGRAKNRRVEIKSIP